jgi:hypothetical protein
MLPDALRKHKFSGIGAASAAMVLAALASNPATAWFVVGIPGKVVNWILTWVFTIFASVGLVVLNIGSAKIQTLVDGKKFDGAWDSAEEFIAAIRNAGREMTPEEIKRIDDPVIEAFRKWASFARKKK